MQRRRKEVTATLVAVCAALILFASVTPARASVPSIEQVYQAAHAGHLAQAEAMTRQVLQTYPNSARAHYVMAQILAAEGRTEEARSYLEAAERLKPGLPFANRGSVANLEARINGGQRSPVATHPNTNQFHWWWWLIAAAIIFFILRAISGRRSARTEYSDGSVSTGSVPAAPRPAWPFGGYGGGGLLSSVLAGLGFGAGAAAGERAVDRMFGREREEAPAQPEIQEPSSGPADLGGDEFGVQPGESSSGGWEDSGASSNPGDDFDAGNAGDGGWDDSSGSGGGTDV